MNRLVMGSIALLGLAGCTSGNGVQATAPAPLPPTPVTGSFRSNPPDDPTGSQQYQSPDLDSRHPIPGQNR